MALPIRFSPQAVLEEIELLDFLKSKWGVKKAKEIYDKIELILAFISEMPKIYPSSQLSPHLRKCVLSKQTSIYYRIEKGYIEIVSIRNNRADPKL